MKDERKVVELQGARRARKGYRLRADTGDLGAGTCGDRHRAVRFGTLNDVGAKSANEAEALKPNITYRRGWETNRLHRLERWEINQPIDRRSKKFQRADRDRRIVRRQRIEVGILFSAALD